MPESKDPTFIAMQRFFSIIASVIAQIDIMPPKYLTTAKFVQLLEQGVSGFLDSPEGAHLESDMKSLSKNLKVEMEKAKEYVKFRNIVKDFPENPDDSTDESDS